MSRSIALVIPKLTSYGGAERLVVECVARWQDRHEVTIYTSESDPRLLEEHGVGDQVRVRRLTPFFKGPHAWLVDRALIPRIWEREIALGHDVYNGHQWYTGTLGHQPMVWYPHEPMRVLYDLVFERDLEAELALAPPPEPRLGPGQRFHDVINPNLGASFQVAADLDRVADSTRIVANSRYSAQYLADVYGRPVDDVVYPGVSVDEFEVRRPEGNLFLAVGGLRAHKQTDLILQALSLVPDARLYIVSSDRHKDSFNRQAWRLGVHDRVFVLSGLRTAEVHELYARCLATVFVPYLEPFGIVALEAMASAKPLIATGEGGYAEVVDESCAFLVPPEPGAIAQKMKLLMDEPDRAERMGRAGRERVQRYSWDATAEGLERILLEEAERARQAAAQVPMPVHERSIGLDSTLIGFEYWTWFRAAFECPPWTRPDGTLCEMPALGYYASTHGRVIRRHLDRVDEVGARFLLVNLHVNAGGLDPIELHAFDYLMRISRDRPSPVAISIQLRLGDCDERSIRRALHTLRPAFDEPNFMRWKGRPIVFVVTPGDLAEPERESWQKALRHSGRECLFVQGRQRPGWHLYDADVRRPSDPPPQDREFQVALVRNPPRAEFGAPQQALHALRSQVGDLMAWERPPNLVVFSSFNGFHDGSAIEPSTREGTTLLTELSSLNQALASQWRPAARDPSVFEISASPDKDAIELIDGPAELTLDFSPACSRMDLDLMLVLRSLRAYGDVDLVACRIPLDRDPAPLRLRIVREASGIRFEPFDGEFSASWSHATDTGLQHGALDLDLRLTRREDEARVSEERRPVYLTREAREAAAARRKRLSSATAGRGLSAPPYPVRENAHVRLVAPDVWERDSIGNFTFAIASLLRAHGVPVTIHANRFDSSLQGLVRPVAELFRDPSLDDVLFYQFSIGDPLLDAVLRLPSRKAAYYHGVTPPEFFQAFNPLTAQRCASGLEAAAKLEAFSVLLAASHATERDLSARVGGRSVTLCPPIVDARHWDTVDAVDAADIGSEGPKHRWLYVGRMAPNKKVEDLLALLDAFCQSEPDVELTIVGDDRQSVYRTLIRSLLEGRYRDLADRVRMAGECSNAELKGLYERSTAFVTLTEHEGFCVPLVEALYFGKPVFAWGQEAVRETLGGAGMLFEKKDFPQMARDMLECLGDGARLDAMAVAGRARFEVLAREADGRCLWAALEPLLSADAGRD